MTKRETTLAQPPDVTGDPLEPSAAAWLPLTAADSGLVLEREAPKHEWPATLFIFLANLTAIGLGLGAVGATVGVLIGILNGGGSSTWLTALFAVGLAFGCVVQRTLGANAENFSRWGWWGAMTELALATLSKARVVVEDPSLAGTVGFGIILDLLWMQYFWKRRADFGIDELDT